MKVSIIVAVHNRLNYTQRCLNSIYKSQTKHELETILVDDGSTDGTSDWILENMPGVTILKGDGSLWFGGATQMGINYVLSSKAPADYILTLNNDTFPYPDAIDTMVAFSDDQTVVAAAYFEEDTNRESSAGFQWHFWSGLIGLTETSNWTPSKTAKIGVDAVATTATLIPVKLMRGVKPISLRLHPHNRYDALLSANLRNAGARFVVPTKLLFSHLYGGEVRHVPCRQMSISEFWKSRFSDPILVSYLPGQIHLGFFAAPNRFLGIVRCLHLFLIFVAQLFVVASQMFKKRI